MTNPWTETLELLFVWAKEEKFGLFLDRARYRFWKRFLRAIHSSDTWGEFLENLGPGGAEYIQVFAENGGGAWPDPSDLLADLCDDVWLLSDTEFPAPQCAEEAYTEYADHLKRIPNVTHVWTEYGARIGMFPKSEFLSIQSILRTEGVFVEPVEDGHFLGRINDYGRP